MSKSTKRKIHKGRNVKRFREMPGLKQEGLAYELGEDWNQKKVSLLNIYAVVGMPLGIAWGVPTTECEE